MEENQNVNVNEENQNSNENSGENKTYTVEEVQKLIQAEADRRTNQALAKQKKDYEKKMSLASLDESKRADAEKDMRIQELQEQLKQFTIEKNKSEIKSILGSRGLDVRLADLINITDDIEASQSNIDMLDKIIKDNIKEEIEKRLSNGNSPKDNNTNKENLTEKEIKKMSLADMEKLKNNNPELFKKYFS